MHNTRPSQTADHLPDGAEFGEFGDQPQPDEDGGVGEGWGGGAAELGAGFEAALCGVTEEDVGSSGASSFEGAAPWSSFGLETSWRSCRSERDVHAMEKSGEGAGSRASE